MTVRRPCTTLGEITDVFREVFGVYQEPVIVCGRKTCEHFTLRIKDSSAWQGR